jgi:hypothetical protein
MTTEQIRIVKAEMMRYGVTMMDVAAVFHVDPSLVSHAVAGRFKKPDRYREQIARMVLAAKLKVDPDKVSNRAVLWWMSVHFPEEA